MSKSSKMNMYTVSFLVKCFCVDMFPNTHKILATWFNYMPRNFESQ